jgi:hypothetical protein
MLCAQLYADALTLSATVVDVPDRPGACALPHALTVCAPHARTDSALKAAVSARVCVVRALPTEPLAYVALARQVVCARCVHVVCVQWQQGDDLYAYAVAARS